jgi:hypothetical protein
MCSLLGAIEGGNSSRVQRKAARLILLMQEASCAALALEKSSSLGLQVHFLLTTWYNLAQLVDYATEIEVDGTKLSTLTKTEPSLLQTAIGVLFASQANWTTAIDVNLIKPYIHLTS